MIEGRAKRQEWMDSTVNRLFLMLHLFIQVLATQITLPTYMIE